MFQILYDVSNAKNAVNLRITNQNTWRVWSVAKKLTTLKKNGSRMQLCKLSWKLSSKSAYVIFGKQKKMMEVKNKRNITFAEARKIVEGSVRKQPYARVVCRSHLRNTI